MILWSKKAQVYLCVHHSSGVNWKVECLFMKDTDNTSFWNSPPGPPTMSRDTIMKNFMGAMQWDENE